MPNHPLQSPIGEQVIIRWSGPYIVYKGTPGTIEIASKPTGLNLASLFNIIEKSPETLNTEPVGREKTFCISSSVEESVSTILFVIVHIFYKAEWFSTA